MDVETVSHPESLTPAAGRIARWVPGIASIAALPPGALVTEIVAGVTVAAISVPGGLAMAQLMGIPAVIGLYACIIPSLVYALVGPSSRFLVVGPDTGTCVMLAASATALGATSAEARFDVIQALTLLVAILCLVAYVFRLGLITKLVSRPVLLGYIAGVAATLLIKQLKPLTGIALESRGLFRPLVEVVRRSAEINWLTVGLGVALFVLLRVIKSFLKPVPGPVVVIVLGIAASWWFGLAAHGVAVVGKVPSGLPGFDIPANPGHWSGLLEAAGGIMIITAASGILTASAFGEYVGARSRPNQELRSFGLANLGAAFFQGFVVTGSDSRTAASISAGGRSALVGIVSAMAVGLVAMFLVGPIALLPSAALAAILASAAIDLVDVPGFRALARINRYELVLALVAIAGVVWVGVLEGVIIAVGATLGHLVVLAARPRDSVMGREPGGYALVTLRRDPNARQSPGIVAYLFESSLFFVNAEYFGDRVRLALQAEPDARYLVLDTSIMMHADSSAVAVLISLVEELKGRGITVLIGGGHGRFREILFRAGIADLIGHDHIFLTPEEAFTAAEAMRDAEAAP